MLCVSMGNVVLSLEKMKENGSVDAAGRLFQVLSKELKLCCSSAPSYLCITAEVDASLPPNCVLFFFLAALMYLFFIYGLGDDS